MAEDRKEKKEDSSNVFENQSNEVQDSDKPELAESDKNKTETKEKKTVFKRKSKSDNSKELKELREKNEELKDKYLRLVAEYDNFRKRTAKEKLELREVVTGSVITEILSVIDDFDRAVEYNKNSEDINAVVEGINIIYKKMTDFLKSKSVKEIDAMHQDFDTDFHEAITKIPASSDDLKGKVVDVIQKGYMMNDKIIRYAKVVVGE